jgi:hypothetical protein
LESFGHLTLQRKGEGQRNAVVPSAHLELLRSDGVLFLFESPLLSLPSLPLDALVNLFLGQVETVLHSGSNFSGGSLPSVDKNE